MTLERPIVFFDLETTGTDKNFDRIVEISMLKLYPDSNQEIKTTRVNPLITIPKAASDVHGIADEDVKAYPTFRQIAKAVLNFLTGCDIAGYNSNAFDVPFLYNEFHRAGVVWDYSGINFIDVGNIFKRKNERTLAAAYKFYCGEDLQNAHSAEADIIATMEVFKAQVTKHDDLPTSAPELAKYSNFDKEIIDLGGCFSKDETGDYVFNFGKHKGKKCHEELSYLEWMRGANFLPDAIQICNSILNHN
jgi:DNA polymerase-3 subunit epsilon